MNSFIQNEMMCNEALHIYISNRIFIYKVKCRPAIRGHYGWFDFEFEFSLKEINKLKNISFSLSLSLSYVVSPCENINIFTRRFIIL